MSNDNPGENGNQGFGRGISSRPKELRKPNTSGGHSFERLSQHMNQLSMNESTDLNQSTNFNGGGGDVQVNDQWSYTGDNSIKGNSQASNRSALNPNAVEFVPQRYVPPNEMNFHQDNRVTTNFIMNGSGRWNNGDDIIDPSRRDGVLETDDFVALNELKDFIDSISSQPAKYETHLPYITDVLNSWMDEDVDYIMECTVNTIVDQAIMDTNFRYNGVRLCIHLISSLRSISSKGGFKEILLQRLHREHARRESLVVATDGGVYLRGLTMFLGDLCTKLPEKVLFEAVPELINTLLAHPTTENLKCACQVLKLCGANLDGHFKNSSLSVMDKIMDNLKSITNTPTANRSTKELAANLVEMRGRGWTSAVVSSNNSNPYAAGDHTSFNSFYPPDQNNASYDFGPCGDEDDNDVCEAFEEFLKASGQLQ